MVRLAVQLDEEPELRVGEVGATHECAALVANDELAVGKLEVGPIEYSEKRCFQLALCELVPTDSSLEDWPDNANSSPTSPRDPVNEALHIGDSNQALAQSSLQCWLDEPAGVGTEINDRTLRCRDPDPFGLLYVLRTQVLRLVHDEVAMLAAPSHC